MRALPCLMLSLWCAPAAAEAPAVDLTAPTSDAPYVAEVAAPCGADEIAVRFRVWEEGAPVAGAEILAAHPGPMAEAADPDDLGQVMETALLAGSDCDAPANLATLSPKVAFLAETVDAVGMRHAGIRLGDQYFARALADPMPLDYGGACLTVLSAGAPATAQEVRRALSAGEALRDRLADSPPEGQFMVTFNQAAFDVAKDLARCAFDSAAEARDLGPKLLIGLGDLNRLGAMLDAEAEIDTAPEDVGDWRLRRRGWGATALAANGGEGWFGYACTLTPGGSYRWAFVLAQPGQGDRVRLGVDGVSRVGQQAGRAERRFEGIDADFRYLDFGAASDGLYDAVRAARSLTMSAPRAAVPDLAWPTRGSSAALAGARDHCRALSGRF